MKLNDVKKYLKKDDAPFWIMINRYIGLYITWILLNIFPNIKANTVTISMLFLNIISFGFLYISIIEYNLYYLALYFIIKNLSMCLDCVDGNVARINNDKSIFGLFLDRLVHNISYPLLFGTIGFALYDLISMKSVLIIFLISGLLTELSPIELAKIQIENMFYKQEFGVKNTTQYDMAGYRLKSAYVQNNYKKSNYIKKALTDLINTITLNNIPIWNKLFLSILLDVMVFPQVFIFTNIVAIEVIIRRLIRSLLLLRRSINDIETQFSN